MGGAEDEVHGLSGDLWERPYTVTNGRTRPSTPLDLMSQVWATDGVSPVQLQPEHAQALRVCRSPTSIAEIAALLKHPVMVTKILVADLIAVGAVVARHPDFADSSNSALLRKLLDGLRKL